MEAEAVKGSLGLGLGLGYGLGYGLGEGFGYGVWYGLGLGLELGLGGGGNEMLVKGFKFSVIRWITSGGYSNKMVIM